MRRPVWSFPSLLVSLLRCRPSSSPASPGSTDSEGRRPPGRGAPRARTAALGRVAPPPREEVRAPHPRVICVFNSHNCPPCARERRAAAGPGGFTDLGIKNKNTVRACERQDTLSVQPARGPRRACPVSVCATQTHTLDGLLYPGPHIVAKIRASVHPAGARSRHYPPPNQELTSWELAAALPLAPSQSLR